MRSELIAVFALSGCLLSIAVALRAEPMVVAQMQVTGTPRGPLTPGLTPSPGGVPLPTAAAAPPR